MFKDGLHRTIDWYVATHRREEVEQILDKRLMGR
jgi:hypothetical protein